MRYRMTCRRVCFATVCALFAIHTAHAAPSADEILQQSGVKGGLVVHLGCGDGELTAALRAGDGFLVKGLDTNVENIERARRHIRAHGLYGPVSVDVFDGRSLPLIDNLVNLLVADDLGDVPMAEVTRVLAPRGVAMIGGKKTVKPWPEAIDQWTHFLHGPNNNAVAEDRIAGPPRRMQWLAGPAWTRHHHADKGTYPTIRAVVSARGRLFYMVDETPSSDRKVPSRWSLAARDGFSGVLLWKKPIRATIYERRLEQVWRALIADGDRVYVSLGTDLPISQLDAATGETVRSYDGTEGFQEAIKSGGTLFVINRQGAILALSADTGKRLWQWAPDRDAIVPVTLAASEGKVFVKTDAAVFCFSAEPGKTIWKTPLEGAKKKMRLRFPRERLIVKDGVVLCSHGGNDPAVLNADKFIYLGSHPRVHDYGGKLAALSAEDGRVLWRSDYLPGLESMPGEIYISDGLVWLGPAFARPRDLQTGKIKRTREVLERLWTTGHHYRCYPGKATCNYIITAKRGIEMFDLTGENHSRNNWVRATCRVGVLPCNGLLYAPPHSCGCYMEAKLFGFWALAAGRTKDEGLSTKDEKRLVKGPAFGKIKFSPSSLVLRTSVDWPTHRCDAARSGSTKTAVPAELEPLWTADLGGRLSAVTVADGKAFVAQVDAHIVHALDAKSGKPLWQFTAAGRIDSPPTVYHVGRISNPSRDGSETHPTALCLFGARDGYVYCLRASDGAMAWRFLAARRPVHAVAYEQVESLWPVHGSVLVHNGTAYAAAGRSSHLDGGIMLYGLDPVTGKVLCETSLTSEHTGAMDPPADKEQVKMARRISQNYTDYKTFLAADRSDSFSMRGALTGMMTADGDSIFMRHLRFDGKLVQQNGPRAHLFSTSNLLDGSEHNRSYWVLGTGDFARTPVAYPWIVARSLRVPYGLVLAFDDKTVWGVHRAGGKGKKSGYALFAMPRPDPEDKASLLPDFAQRSGTTKRASATWTSGLPFRPRAMVRAGDALIVGGMTEQYNAGLLAGDDTTAEKDSGILQIVSADNGETLAQRQLAAPPVWDGMSAANGRLYVSTRNGKVVCLGSR